MHNKNTIVGEFWRELENDKVQCDLCPRRCQLQNGQRGFCYVRANQNQQVVLNSYGLSSGFCIDPIEKKPLNHFYPGTSVLSFGTAGCNLACKFCQNWDISKSREIQTLSAQATPEQIAQSAKRSDQFDWECAYCVTQCGNRQRSGHLGRFLSADWL